MMRFGAREFFGFLGYMDWVICMVKMAFQRVSPRLEVVHVKGRGHILEDGDV